MDRISKIKLLNDLKAGRVSLSSLSPKRLLIKIRNKEAGGAQKLIDNKPVSSEKFEAEFQAQHSSTDQIKIHVRRLEHSEAQG